jgi:hypothetical protein
MLNEPIHEILLKSSEYGAEIFKKEEYQKNFQLIPMIAAVKIKNFYRI